MTWRFLAASLALVAVGAGAQRAAATAPSDNPPVIVAISTDGDVVLFDADGSETARFADVLTSSGLWSFAGIAGPRLAVNDDAAGQVVVVDIATGDVIRLDTPARAWMVRGSDDLLMAGDFWDGSTEATVVDLGDLTTVALGAPSPTDDGPGLVGRGSRASADGSVIALPAGGTGDTYIASPSRGTVQRVAGQPLAVTAKRVITTTTADGVTDLIRYSPDGVERSRVTVPWSRAFAALPDGGVVVVDDDGGVHRVDPDVTTADLIGTVSMRPGDIPSVSVAFAGERVVVGYDDGVETIHLDDALPGQTIVVEDGTPWIVENFGGETRCTFFEVDRGPVLAADLHSGRLVDLGRGAVSAVSDDVCTLSLIHI